MTGLRRGTTSATPLTANDANNDRLTYSLEADDTADGNSGTC